MVSTEEQNYLITNKQYKKVNLNKIINNMKNNYFPFLNSKEVEDINNVCQQHNFKFIYNPTTQMSYLLDQEKNIHGNVSQYHGYIVIKIGHILISLFRYVKLTPVLDKVLNVNSLRYKFS
jgi:hypothetical protein